MEYVAVIRDKHMDNTFHIFYSGKIPSELQDILLAYICCHIISQEVHMTFDLSVEA